MTEELTLPGFLHDTCSTTHSIFLQSPVWRDRELPLAEYGLEYIHADPATHVVFPDGSSLTQWMDIDRTCEAIAKFSRRDAATYRKMVAEWQSVSPIFNKIRYTPAGWSRPLAEELAEHPQGGIWLRRQALSAWEIIDAAFEDWHLKSWMLWFAEGTLQPGERPGTGTLAYSFVAGRQKNGWVIPKGGSWSLPLALRRIIEKHGGTILTDEKILATEIRSPLDLERINRHNWHGSCHGGDMSPAQSEALRPVPGYAQHRLPIPGLYQTGSTTHPGGSVTGGPGRNAAMVLLKDLGRDFYEVIRS
jgi:phytoene dehydrogenase-like protein